MALEVLCCDMYMGWKMTRVGNCVKWLMYVEFVIVWGGKWVINAGV